MARAYLFIVGVSAGLGLLSGGAAADGMPTPGVVVAPERSWSLEVGARYWYSVGRNKYDYFNDPTPTRGGKRKRLFEVTASGLRAAQELRRVREQLWHTIESQP